MPATEVFPDIDPSVATNLNLNFRVKEVNFGDGYSQRLTDGLNSESEDWIVVFDRISDTDKNTIRAFVSARGGSAEPFLWTAPRALTQKQYVVKDFSARPDNYLTWTLRMRFEEDFSL